MARIVPQREGGATAISMPATRKKRVFTLTPYLFILPHLTLFALFFGYPFFSGLYVSLHQYNYLRPEANKFIGLDNYINLFTPGTNQFRNFWNSMGNTVQFVIYSVPVLIVIPLLLAVLLNSKVKFVNVFRAIYFAPWVLSVAVTSLIWWWIFQSQGGLINSYLRVVGIDPPRWLATLPSAWVAIVVATVWWTMGFNMIILLAALQDIAKDLYEAATVDGATKIQMFFRITIPMLQPVLVFIITISIIASFNLFGQPFFMTQGGPVQGSGDRGTEPVMYQIYREGFERNNQGSASAMSFVVAVIMVIISYVNFRVFRQRD
ncbi:MAG: putative transporter permease protein [Chloroflexi bacterium]|jgi:multiple sugar transport system permease protein|nr:putative transporter permease protein [Chloroflexota bacterium]